MARPAASSCAFVMRKPDESLARDLLRSSSVFIRFFCASSALTFVLIDIPMTSVLLPRTRFWRIPHPPQGDFVTVLTCVKGSSWKFRAIAAAVSGGGSHGATSVDKRRRQTPSTNAVDKGRLPAGRREC